MSFWGLVFALLWGLFCALIGAAGVVAWAYFAIRGSMKKALHP